MLPNNSGGLGILEAGLHIGKMHRLIQGEEEALYPRKIEKKGTQSKKSLIEIWGFHQIQVIIYRDARHRVKGVIQELHKCLSRPLIGYFNLTSFYKG